MLVGAHASGRYRKISLIQSRGEAWQAWRAQEHSTSTCLLATTTTSFAKVIFVGIGPVFYPSVSNVIVGLPVCERGFFLHQIDRRIPLNISRSTRGRLNGYSPLLVTKGMLLPEPGFPSGSEKSISWSSIDLHASTNSRGSTALHSFKASESQEEKD